MITIAKASAGSGKTYTLAKTYISLLLKANDPYAYRSILAVTFTNKATGEMKARILKELDILAHSPQDSDYYKDFVPSICADASRLQQRCTLFLNSILHDYSAFSVFTIDKFFQQVLRSFARELGQFDSYQLELDKPSVVAESVDRMLDNLSDKDTETLDYLKESVMNQISSKGYFQLEPALYSAAADLQSSQFKHFLAEKGISDPAKVYSKANMRSLRGVCDALIKKFSEDVKASAERLNSMFKNAGIEPAKDTLRGFAKVLPEKYCKLKEKDEVAPPTDSFCRQIVDRNKIFSKANASLAGSLPEGFEAEAQHFVSLFRETPDGDFSPYWKAYKTALTVKEMTFGYGISRELSDSFNTLLKDKNILCLEDSNGLLSRIIDGSDVPFVYEKTGVRYKHFLLDEFQDTSLVQWDNFRPLLHESDSNNNDNLVVGDVKQSIYRWRQSDWNLLNSVVAKEFPGSRELLGKDGKPALSVNYRTEENIVEFNDLFFEFLRDHLAGDFIKSGAEEAGEMITGIYSDVRQAASRKGAFGEVRLCFAGGDKNEGGDAVLERTVQQVIALKKEKGANYKDIAIIVRNNAPGEQIAEALMAEGVPVISDDSLSVNNSIVVRRLVSVLSSVENPENRVSGYLAGSLGFTDAGQSSLVDLAESIIRSFREKDSQLVESHALYVQAFMDWMQSWVSRNGNRLKDFLRAWDEKAASLRIASPSSSDAVRIITIHKSKGLEFPYVIIPYFENIKFFRSDAVWAEPSVPGLINPSASGSEDNSSTAEPAEVSASGSGSVKEIADFDKAVSAGIFKLLISSKSTQTYFADTYRREQLYQSVDAMNLMYVAMTRPERGLSIICGKASSGKEDGGFSTAADALLSFAVSHAAPSSDEEKTAQTGPQPFSAVEFNVSESDWGVDYVFGRHTSEKDLEFRKAGKKEKYEKKIKPDELDSSYPSFSTDASELKVNRDAADFFSPKEMEEKKDSFSSKEMKKKKTSNRLRGIVLHKILSDVTVPEDLPLAVTKAVDAGDISQDLAKNAYNLLRRRISDAREQRGWFTEKKEEVFNECALASDSGKELRPDRVSIVDGKVLIIDYKFASIETPLHDKYCDQVRSYIKAYRGFGYTDVKGCLWYVWKDDVEYVEYVE